MSLSLLWAGSSDADVTTQLPDSFSDQVKEVAAKIMQLCDAETMVQHQRAVDNLSNVCVWACVREGDSGCRSYTHTTNPPPTQDVVLSTSLFTFSGNDSVRVGLYRTKFFASLEATPILAEVNTSDTKQLTILYLMEVGILPKRTWINPIGFVLPRRVSYTYIVKVHCCGACGVVNVQYTCIHIYMCTCNVHVYMYSIQCTLTTNGHAWLFLVVDVFSTNTQPSPLFPQYIYTYNIIIHTMYIIYTVHNIHTHTTYISTHNIYNNTFIIITPYYPRLLWAAASV